MEQRFYIAGDYFCPECRLSLMWESRLDTKDSLILVHPESHPTLPTCSRSAKKYYAPGVNLTVFQP